MIKEEDIFEFIVSCLRSETGFKSQGYGYDLYLPGLMSYYIKEYENSDHNIEYRRKELSPIFYAAAWSLCRRGILRPGVKEYGEQSTPDGSAGNGYSITPFGRKWLSEVDYNSFVPTEPGRLAELFANYKNRFGIGYHQRSQEAIRCYGAHAFLACCTMCGAASESILLSIAVAKKGNEDDILNTYKQSSGRRKIEDYIFGKMKKGIKESFVSGISLLKYWRDESAHGRASDIKDIEAFTTLTLLLRFAQLSEDNWGKLVENV